MKIFWQKLAERWRLIKAIRTRGDGWLFLRMLVFAAAVPLRMRFQMQHVAAAIEPTKTFQQGNESSLQRIVSTFELVLKVAFPLVRRGCLTRAITLYHFLRKEGWDVQLAFGTGEVKSRFEGHCWLIYKGEPFLEKTDPRPVFKPLFTVRDGRVTPTAVAVETI